MMQTRKFTSSRVRKSEGVTLIELLIVMAVVGVMGAMLVTVFFNLLRGSSKTSAVSEVRQEGDYVLTSMTNSMRYGKRAVLSTGACSTPARSGPAITITTVDDASVTFTCPPTSSGTLTKNDGTGSVQLFNVSESLVTACTFTCLQENLATLPTVGIQFTLSKRNASKSEDTASIPFSTAVTLRNYRP